MGKSEMVFCLFFQLFILQKPIQGCFVDGQSEISWFQTESLAIQGSDDCLERTEANRKETPKTSIFSFRAR